LWARGSRLVMDRWAGRVNLQQQQQQAPPLDHKGRVLCVHTLMGAVEGSEHAGSTAEQLRVPLCTHCGKQQYLLRSSASLRPCKACDTRCQPLLSGGACLCFALPALHPMWAACPRTDSTAQHTMLALARMHACICLTSRCASTVMTSPLYPAASACCTHCCTKALSLMTYSWNSKQGCCDVLATSWMLVLAMVDTICSSSNGNMCYTHRHVSQSHAVLSHQAKTSHACECPAQRPHKLMCMCGSA
jgi:hypothetical protein